MMHYYSEQKEFNPFKISIDFKKKKYEFWSSNGVFSKDKLDKGTEALLLYTDVKDKKILDLGCGYGVVGILLALNNNCVPEFSDTNNNAVKLTKLNCKLHKVDAKIKKRDLYDKDSMYDAILVNPPYVAGRELIKNLVQGAKNHLNTGGSLQLVVRYQKGGKFLEEYMKQVFGNVETLGKKSGFRVFKSKK